MLQQQQQQQQDDSHDGFTTEKYWDCECEENYIHFKTETKCIRCGMVAKAMPDSRVDEVLAAGLPL